MGQFGDSLKGGEDEVVKFKVLGRIVLPGHHPEEGVEMFIVVHVVQEAGFNNFLLDGILGEGGFEVSAPVDPGPLDDVGEEEEGGELQLGLLGLGVDVEEEEGEIGVFLALPEEGVGGVDLIRRGPFRVDGGECLSYMTDIECCLHNNIRVKLQYVPLTQAHRHRQEGQRYSPDYSGKKLMYHLQQGKETRWIDYEQMIDDIHLVIDYEKRRKGRFVAGKPNLQSQPACIEIDDNDDEAKEEARAEE